MTDPFLTALDWGLRGGTVTLTLLIAALLMRDHGRATDARLGALFALGTAAYAICSAAGFSGHATPVTAPLLALSAGNNVVFWLLTAALFDDAFRMRWWHGGLWLTFVVLGLVQCLAFSPDTPAPGWLGIGLTLSSLTFAGLAVLRTLASWREDLVERRRRLRAFVVGASAAYIGAAAFFQLAGPRPGSLAPSLTGAVALLVIATVAAWSLLRLSASQTLFAGTTRSTSAADAPSGIDRAVNEPGGPASATVASPDQALLAALEHSMAVDRLYRREGLAIGDLAQVLGLPEYRLRRLINQGLGHRNFNSFLNGYRIAEIRAALADPTQADVPVLTLALDAGFSSLGPFNRAFKAETGMTPTDYRRQHGNGTGMPTAKTGVASPISESASAISNPAGRISAAP